VINTLGWQTLKFKKKKQKIFTAIPVLRIYWIVKCQFYGLHTKRVKC